MSELTKWDFGQGTVFMVGELWCARCQRKVDVRVGGIGLDKRGQKQDPVVCPKCGWEKCWWTNRGIPYEQQGRVFIVDEESA